MKAHRKIIGTIFTSFSQEQVRRRVRRDALDDAYELAEDYGLDTTDVDSMVDDRLRKRMAYSTLNSVEFGHEAGYGREEMRETAEEVAGIVLDGDDGIHDRKTAADLLRTYGIGQDVVDADIDLFFSMHDGPEQDLVDAVLYADDRDELYELYEERVGFAFADPDTAIEELDDRIAERYDHLLQTEIDDWQDEAPSMDVYERMDAAWFVEEPAAVIEGFWDQ